MDLRMSAKHGTEKRSVRKDPIWVDRMIVSLKRGKKLINAVGVQAYFDYRKQPKKVDDKEPWFESTGVLDDVNYEKWLRETVPANGDWRGLEHYFNGRYRSRRRK